jgi:hypothetical protein
MGQRNGEATMPAQKGAVGAAILLAFAAMPLDTRRADAEPVFRSLAGSWRGSGQMRVEGQKPERLSCRAYYTAKSGGSALGIAIRCASAANKIELRAQVTEADGKLSGSWNETTFNVGGDVSGKAGPGRLTLSISGGVVGSMTVAFSGRTQTVTIATQGVSLKGVSISLSRG